MNMIENEEKHIISLSLQNQPKGHKCIRILKGGDAYDCIGWLVYLLPTDMLPKDCIVIIIKWFVKIIAAQQFWGYEYSPNKLNLVSPGISEGWEVFY